MKQAVTIQLPVPTDLGPAMKALTDKQRRFVVAWFSMGSREKAAYAAGYAGEPESNLLGVSAYQVWHHPKVQAAIKEFAEASMLYGMIPGAMAAIENVLADPTHKDYVKTAQLVLDRTGFHATMEHRVTHTHTDDRAGMVKRLQELAAKVGQDPRALLQKMTDVQDADFDEVPVGDDDLGDLL